MGKPCQGNRHRAVKKRQRRGLGPPGLKTSPGARRRPGNPKILRRSCHLVEDCHSVGKNGVPGVVDHSAPIRLGDHPLDADPSSSA